MSNLFNVFLADEFQFINNGFNPFNNQYTPQNEIEDVDYEDLTDTLTDEEIKQLN